MTSGSVALRRPSEIDVPALVRLLRRSWLVTWVPESRGTPLAAFLDEALVGMIRVTAEDRAPSRREGQGHKEKLGNGNDFPFPSRGTRTYQPSRRSRSIASSNDTRP